MRAATLASETLARLEGDAVFRAEQNGDITVSTNGHHLWVETPASLSF